MRKLIFILFFIPISLFTQNLVPNPSFDDTLWCPYNTAQINAANHWFSPMNSSGGSSELFHSCNNYPHPPWSTGIVGMPKNPIGYQNARNGDAYGGFILYQGTPETRENIEVQLITSLNPARTYYAEFYVSLANNSSCGIQQVGSHFSKNKIAGLGHSQSIMNLIPQIEYSGSPIIDTLNWVKVSGYFKVQEDGVQYMTIGNFANSGQTVFTKLNNTPENAYYYIDDVLVMDSAQHAQGYGVNELIISNQELAIYPNPASDELNIEIKSLNQNFPFEIEIYNCLGYLVKSLQIKQNKSSVDVSDLDDGIYFIRATTEENMVYSNKVVILH